jgi:hypothetical protein
VDTNTATNATATSASPTSLAGSSSVASHPHPQSNGFAQQATPVGQPNVDKDEFVRGFHSVNCYL